MAARLSSYAVERLDQILAEGSNICGFVGSTKDGMRLFEFHDYERLIDDQYRRPRHQWWMDFVSVNEDLV